MQPCMRRSSSASQASGPALPSWLGSGSAAESIVAAKHRADPAFTFKSYFVNTASLSPLRNGGLVTLGLE
ncbi:unnamed protein product [Linum trigynum]|uniref:Uncharacterized protein n=1 Tax=Linum trigynum TaxID=586398 RepID=A0AAV2FDT1_9ROSI